MRSLLPVLLSALLLVPLAIAQEEPDQVAVDGRVRLLLDEYLLRADDKRARAIAAEIKSIDGMTVARVTNLMQGLMPRLPQPSGTTTLTLSLGGEGLDYEVFVFVPENYAPDRFWPLLVTAHGTGGEGLGPLEAMIPAAAKAGLIVASLSESEKRRSKGWGYSDEERQVQEDLIIELRQRFQIDPRRVYMNGWSRGGHASWDLAIRKPGLLAGIGPIVGGVPARDLVLVPNLLGCRIDAVNGALDQPELVAAVTAAAVKLEALGADYRAFLDPARGHDVFSDRLEGMVEFLLAAPRASSPGRIVICSFEKDLLRHDWLAIAGFGSKIYKPGAKITIPGVTAMTPGQRREAWLAHLEEHTARLEARVLPGNVIQLDAHKVKRAKILLPPTGIDLDQVVEIRQGEKKLRSGRFKADLGELLRSARESRDPFQAYPVRLELSVAE